MNPLARKIETGRLATAALGITSIVLGTILVAAIWDRAKTHRLVVAAGSAQGESYILSQALKAVVERHFSRVKLTIRETGGTSENLTMLETRDADLATAQADVPAGPSARIVAVLYEDAFQLLVHGDSTVRRFIDLKGKRIALPQHGGQYQSFLSVAEHFGLKAIDFTFVGADDEEADARFQTGDAEALFRVRALGNSSIMKLSRQGRAHFLSIDQGAAMKIKNPSYAPSVIPQGAYLGDPAIPTADLPTVAIERTLLAHRDLDPDAVFAIASVLTERRQEIAEAIPETVADVRPLAANLMLPVRDGGLGPHIHPGTKDYLDRDKPAFIQQNADFLALVLTALLLLGSWLWELKRWIGRRQKNLADTYNEKVVVLLHEAQESVACRELDRIKTDLLNLLTDAVDALDQDRISDESFQSFRVIWQIAMDAARERQLILSPSAAS